MKVRPWPEVLPEHRRVARARVQEILAGQRAIVLSDSEATRFLDALERPDEGTVARLKALRRGA
jgi:uncharacterized protein (DUF1778 family)